MHIGAVLLGLIAPALGHVPRRPHPRGSTLLAAYSADPVGCVRDVLGRPQPCSALHVLFVKEHTISALKKVVSHLTQREASVLALWLFTLRDSIVLTRIAGLAQSSCSPMAVAHIIAGRAPMHISDLDNAVHTLWAGKAMREEAVDRLLAARLFVPTVVLAMLHGRNDAAALVPLRYTDHVLPSAVAANIGALNSAACAFLRRAARRPWSNGLAQAAFDAGRYDVAVFLEYGDESGTVSRVLRAHDAHTRLRPVYFKINTRQISLSMADTHIANLVRLKCPAVLLLAAMASFLIRARIESLPNAVRASLYIFESSELLLHPDVVSAWGRANLFIAAALLRHTTPADSVIRGRALEALQDLLRALGRRTVDDACAALLVGSPLDDPTLYAWAPRGVVFGAYSARPAHVEAAVDAWPADAVAAVRLQAREAMQHLEQQSDLS